LTGSLKGHSNIIDSNKTLGTKYKENLYGKKEGYEKF